MIQKIQLLGSEEDLDNGCYAIMHSGEGAGCLEDEMYFVNERVVEILRKQNIKFKLIK